MKTLKEIAEEGASSQRHALNWYRAGALLNEAVWNSKCIESVQYIAIARHNFDLTLNDLVGVVGRVSEPILKAELTDAIRECGEYCRELMSSESFQESLVDALDAEFEADLCLVGSALQRRVEKFQADVFKSIPSPELQELFLLGKAVDQVKRPSGPVIVLPQEIGHLPTAEDSNEASLQPAELRPETRRCRSENLTQHEHVSSNKKSDDKASEPRFKLAMEWAVLLKAQCESLSIDVPQLNWSRIDDLDPLFVHKAIDQYLRLSLRDGDKPPRGKPPQQETIDRHVIIREKVEKILGQSPQLSQVEVSRELKAGGLQASASTVSRALNTCGTSWEELQKKYVHKTKSEDEHRAVENS